MEMLQAKSKKTGLIYALMGANDSFQTQLDIKFG